MCKDIVLDKMPLLIAPKRTRATFMTNLAAEHMYNWMRKMGLSANKLDGLKCRRLFVTKEMALAKYLEQPKPYLILYWGHGLPDAWVGDEDMMARFLRRSLVKLGVNDNILNCDAIIYTISCFTMEKLGPSLVDRKVRTYFGSPKAMLINPIDNFIEERTIADFIDLFTVGQKMLVMGYDCAEAFGAYIRRSDEILRTYETSGLLENSVQLQNAYKAIKINREYFGVIGDLNARWTTHEWFVEKTGVQLQDIQLH